MVMEMFRAIRDYALGVETYPVYEGQRGEEFWFETKSTWQPDAFDPTRTTSFTEGLSESIASWIGIALPKRVSVIHDLDSTTVFALEVFKIVPPSCIAILAVLGVIFLICLGMTILKFVWTQFTRRLRPRSRLSTPTSSAPPSVRGRTSRVSAEVAAVLATVAANNSGDALARYPEGSVEVSRRRRGRCTRSVLE